MLKKETNKIDLGKKGFTLVEILAAIVIIAILSTVGIYSISSYMETGKKSYNEGLEDQVALSAKSFYPENSSRIPVRTGEYDYVTFQELASLKYLKGDVVDVDNRNCMTESYVTVEKTNKGLKYTVCLICGEEGNKKSYINEKTACHKDKTPEEIEPEDEELTCKVYQLGNKKFKFEVSNAADVNQIEEIGYYKKGDENNKIKIKKTLNGEYDLSTKAPGEYKFYIVQYGKQEKECSGTAIVEAPSNIICKASSIKNQLNTEITTTLALTNESTNGKKPMDLVTKILKYKNDKLETTYTKTGTNQIPSDLKFTSSYGSYIYQVIYDEVGISKTATCTGDVSLEIPDLVITKKFIPTSSYGTYNGKEISDSALASLSDYSNEKWQNGYVYVKIENAHHFESIKVNNLKIENDYFWISIQGDKTTSVEATGKDSLKTIKTKNIATKLDRTTPSVTIVAKKKTKKTEVKSDTWTNEGLDFTLIKQVSGASGYTIYYCKDTANTCSPTTKATSETAITSYNTLEGIYYIRYKITGGSGISSKVESYTAKVDTIPPSCDKAERDGTTSGGNVKYKYTFSDEGSGVVKERHGHCYAQTSYNKNDELVLCKTQTAKERLEEKEKAGSWDHTFSKAYKSCVKSYNFQYSEGTVYIYFQIQDNAGNQKKCFVSDIPYSHTYTHTW